MLNQMLVSSRGMKEMGMRRMSVQLGTDHSCTKPALSSYGFPGNLLVLSSSLHALDSCRTACFIIVLTVDRARFVFSFCPWHSPK